MMQTAKSDNDDRVQVAPMTSPPYKWICRLEIAGVSSGTGFKIRIPDITHSVVVTSAKNVLIGDTGIPADTIFVNFPEQHVIKVSSSDVYLPHDVENEGCDYALILLPDDNSDDGFGWSTIIPDNELNNRPITICGFPSDKHNTMWITGRQIKRYVANVLYYDNVDPKPGHGGRPVYTWYGGYWTVLGVDCYHNSVYADTSAARFTAEMISRFLQFMNCLKPKTLECVQYRNVYLRCDGYEVEGCANPVNCQYKPPGTFEKFYIIPVETGSPSASKNSPIVALQSLFAEPNKVYLRMDPKDMDEPMEEGGGHVDCQTSVSTLESFVMEKWTNDTYSFRSLQSPQCRIRMDGRKVNEPVKGGAGLVNCQYDPKLEDVSDWEKFIVNEVYD